MTNETYDNLSATIGRKMTNREWKDLLAEEFGVSKTCAKEMLHAIMDVKKLKDIRRITDEKPW